MKEKIEVIVGDINDEGHVNAMLNQLDLYMQDPMGGHGKLSSELALTIKNGLKQQPNYLFFLAKTDDEYVGLANCFVNFSTFRGKPLVNIHDFAVNPLFRKKGVGKALMDFIFKYATEKGYCKVNLEVRHDNEKAQNLYRKMGFNECRPPMFFWEKLI